MRTASHPLRTLSLILARRLHWRADLCRTAPRGAAVRRLGWTLLAAGWLCCFPTAITRGFSAELVRLDPALQDTLASPDAARFGLFTDVPGLQAVIFETAPWGGYLARLRVRTAKGLVWRERNVPASSWRQWQQQVQDVLAGRTTPPPPAADTIQAEEVRGALTDTLPAAIEGAVDSLGRAEPPTRVRVWPEVPLPAALPRPSRADSIPLGYPKLDRRWLVILEAGFRHNISDFGDFFTDMGMIAVTWGYTRGRLMPFFAMEVGFGDLQDDFEKLAGDGRANTYSFSLGLQARQPLDRRTHFYASGAYGYFVRSAQWGGLFFNPNRGTISDGFVLEQQDWGVGLRAGVQIQRKSAKKARFIDIGISYQTSPAEQWRFFDENNLFEADGRDTWLTVSIRFGDSI